MDIGFFIEGYVEVNDVTDAIHIKTPGGHIGGDHNVDCPRLQLINRTYTGFLIHIAVQRGRLKAALAQ